MEALLIVLAFGVLCFGAGYGTRSLISRVRRRRAREYEPYRPRRWSGSAITRISDHDARQKATGAKYGRR
jgi:hypothetical protein